MNGNQPFGGTGNIEQFSLSQFRNQNTFNTNHNMLQATSPMPSIHNSNGNANHINTPFGLQLNGNPNLHTLNNTNNNPNIRNGQSPTSMLQQHSQQQQNHNPGLNINNITNANANANNLIDSLINNNQNNNNSQNQDGFSVNNIDQSQNQNNPLNAHMSEGDVQTILHLQKQTDDFHQHLSNFINTHLPRLPDTMQLMDQLSYDFGANNNKNNNNNDVNMNSNAKGDGNTHLPSLEDQNEENKNNNNMNRSNNPKDLSILRQKLAAITMNCESYKKQFEGANRELLEWKSKFISITQENQKLKNRVSMMENQLIGTRNVALNGGGPRLEGFEFVKYEEGDNTRKYKHTKGVDKLKQRVRGKYDTSKWKIEGDEDLYEYFDSILGFLNENEENVVVPQVLINKNENIMNIDDEDEDENYALIQQTSVIEKYTVHNHPRVSALNGQYGVRARMDIPQHTVIGQYIGVEFLEPEFHMAYSGTQENVLKNIYAFTLTVGDNPTNKKDHKNNNNDKNEVDKIVIDAYGFDVDSNGNKPLLIYVNDCRGDISLEQKTLDDEKEENCLFAKVSLNGWPSIFVITKCKIKKGSELLGFYGNDYYHAVKEKELQQQIRNRNRNIIDHNIIQGQINVHNTHVNLV